MNIIKPVVYSMKYFCLTNGSRANIRISQCGLEDLACNSWKINGELFFFTIGIWWNCGGVAAVSTYW